MSSYWERLFQAAINQDDCLKQDRPAVAALVSLKHILTEQPPEGWPIDLLWPEATQHLELANFFNNLKEYIDESDLETIFNLAKEKQDEILVKDRTSYYRIRGILNTFKQFFLWIYNHKHVNPVTILTVVATLAGVFFTYQQAKIGMMQAQTAKSERISRLMPEISKVIDDLAEEKEKYTDKLEKLTSENNSNTKNNNDLSEGDSKSLENFEISEDLKNRIILTSNLFLPYKEINEKGQLSNNAYSPERGWLLLYLVHSLPDNQLRQLLPLCNFTHADLRGGDLSGKDLSGIDLSFANMKDTKLKNTNFTNAKLNSAWLPISVKNILGARFFSCDLEGAVVSDLHYFDNLKKQILLTESEFYVSKKVLKETGNKIATKQNNSQVSFVIGNTKNNDNNKFSNVGVDTWDNLNPRNGNKSFVYLKTMFDIEHVNGGDNSLLFDIDSFRIKKWTIAPVHIGFQQTLSELLQYGGYPQFRITKTDLGRTHSLKDALVHGNIQEINNYLDSNIDTSDIKINGSLAMFYSLKNYQSEISLKILRNFQNKTNLNMKNAEGKTPLMFAFETKQHKIFDEILYQDSIHNFIDLDIVDNQNKTLIMYIAQYGRVEDLKYIIKRGASLNETDIFKRNALIFACTGGNIDIAKHLINNEKMNKFVRDADGEGLINASMISGDTKMLNYVLEELNLPLAGSFANNQEIIETISSNSGLESFNYICSKIDYNFDNITDNIRLKLSADAILNNDIETLEIIKSDIYNNEFDDAFYLIMFQAAVISNNIKMMEYILDLCSLLKDNRVKGDICILNNFSENDFIDLLDESFFMTALETGSIETFKYLEKHFNFNAKIKSKTGKTAFMFALSSQNKEMIEYFMHNYPNDLMLTDFDSDRKTAFHYASSVGNEAIFKKIYHSINNDSFEDKDFKDSVLFTVIKSGNFELLAFLLDEKNYKIHTVDVQGDTALTIAIQSESLPMVKHIFEMGRWKEKQTGKFDMHAYSIAVVTGVQEIIDYIYDHLYPFDIDHKDIFGDTVLMDSATLPSPTIFNDLINKNADKYVTNNNGENILMRAVEHNPSVEFIKTIIDELEINPTATNINLENALFYAARYSDQSSLETLYQYIPDSNIVNLDGNGLVWAALNEGNKSVIPYLMQELYADPNLFDDDAILPLVLASNINTSTFRLLLEYGANPNQRDLNDNTVLHYLVTLNSAEALDQIDILVNEFGANTMLKNKDQHLPLEILSYEDNEDAFKESAATILINRSLNLFPKFSR